MAIAQSTSKRSKVKAVVAPRLSLAGLRHEAQQFAKRPPDTVRGVIAYAGQSADTGEIYPWTAPDMLSAAEVAGFDEVIQVLIIPTGVRPFINAAARAGGAA